MSLDFIEQNKLFDMYCKLDLIFKPGELKFDDHHLQYLNCRNLWELNLSYPGGIQIYIYINLYIWGMELGKKVPV